MLTTLPEDLGWLQRESHRVECRLFTRAPAGGPWVPLRVVDGSPRVTYGRAGDVPGRSLSATVLADDETGADLRESPDAGDLLLAPLSPFGSWVKAEQVVYRPDGSLIVIPWGIYRLDRWIADDLTGALQITCPDAWQQVEDRGLVSLAMGRVVDGQLFGARVTSMLTEVFGGGIVPWWTHLLDFAGFVDRAYVGTGWTQVDSRPSAIKALVAAWIPGATVICPRTGPAFRVIVPGSGSGDTVEIKAGARGNLVDDGWSDEVDRGDLFNEVPVTYSVERNLLGGQIRTEQRRAIAQYLDPWEELRADGPFGYVTRQAEAMDVGDKTDPSVADANAREVAAGLIGSSMVQHRPIAVQCSPVYGLEQGDLVSVQPEKGGPILTGTLTAATIPLDASGGDWSLTVDVPKLLDASTSAVTWAQFDSAEDQRDDLDWLELRPKRTIDLTEGHGADLVPGRGVGRNWRGWNVTGDKKLRGGGVLVCTSAGGPVTLVSTDAWDQSARERRYRGWASVSGGAGTFEARMVIRWTGSSPGSRAGAWAKISKGKGGTIRADSMVVPAGAARLSLRIETRGMTGNEQLRMNSAGMHYARDRVN